MRTHPISKRTRGQGGTLLALAAVLGLTFVAPATAQETFDQSAFANYEADTSNGEYMFKAAGCAACHASEADETVMSGGKRMDSAIGVFYAPNITASEAGIGGWSNADFLNAVMRGKAPDDRHYYPVFPYTAYAGLKPEDVLDIKAYLETLPQSDFRPPDHEIGLPWNQQWFLAVWKFGNMDITPHVPGDNSQHARGEYLVEAAGHCGECHTPRNLTYGLDEGRAFQGELGLTGAFAPDISKARLDGTTAEDFWGAGLLQGKTLSGSPINDKAMAHLAEGWADLTDEDRRAMYAYLADKEVTPPPPPPEPDPTKPACGLEEEAAPAQVATTDYARAADDFVGTYCRNCHGPGQSSAGSFPAGDLASIARNPAFVTPGDPQKSLLYQSVKSGRMPIGKRPSAGELDDLAAWITALGEVDRAELAVPEQSMARTRDILTYDGEVAAALADIKQVDELDRPYIRYFSYRNQYNGVFPCESPETFADRMKFYRGGFVKLLNSLSYAPRLVDPEVVANTNDTLVRVDLRDLEWEFDDYDRLAVEYFYGVDPDDDPSLAALALETETLLPIMRADFFMSFASRPDIYAYLLDLPDNIEVLERRLGVDATRNIERRDVVRAAFDEGASGVSDHNRLIERHDLPQGGYYWKSYDFAGSRGEQSLRRFPHGPGWIPLSLGLESFKHDGGEMIFSLPNGMQGYYLSTAPGDALEVGPTQIVSFRQRPIGKGIEIRNGRSCFDCHADGILAKRDQLRNHIETSTLFSLDQRDLLLQMYRSQDELDEVYAEDKERFLEALDEINVTEVTSDGAVRSLTGPGRAGGTEIITFYADLYEEDLTFEKLAAEFDLTPEEFEQHIQRVPDEFARRLGQDWINQFNAGLTVPRDELEEQYAYLLEALTQRAPLVFAPYDEQGGFADADDYAGEDPADYEEEAAEEYAAKPYKERVEVKHEPVKPAEQPAYREDAYNEAKLKLGIEVDSTNKYVGDELHFSITTNHDCELQMFYVETSGNVEVFPDAILGGTTLKAGESKRIPDPSAGRLVFDEPGYDEALVAYCAIGGLGDSRLSIDEVRSYVAENAGQPPTRGIAIEVFEKSKGEGGRTATQMVSFNVQPAE
ncbi:c-type cytochrome [Cucumibacter marinus]|uniref:c-type cytochrome n=1 Tax=Cucumibacter marinus TaxID=1121252 RepID=UPI00040F88E4|nr:c-type cytochrome [Cucumibacter marinus]